MNHSVRAACSTEHHVRSRAMYGLMLKWRTFATEHDAILQQNAQPGCATSFLCELQYGTLLISAGHVIHDAMESKKHGVIVTDTCVMDALSKGLLPEDPGFVPLDFFSGCALYSYKPRYGLDYAAIPLDEISRKALEYSSSVVDRDSWADETRNEFDDYLLFGYLHHTMKEKIDCIAGGTASGSTNVAATMLWLRKLSPSESAKYRRECKPDAQSNCMFFEIDQAYSEKSIVGMSGGLIFGCSERDGEYTYTPVAIQGSWFAKSQVLRGTKLSVACLMIERQIEKYAFEGRPTAVGVPERDYEPLQTLIDAAKR